MTCRRARLLAGVAVVAVTALHAAAAGAQTTPSTRGIYTCIDAQGRLLSSDRPIPECSDREQRELGPTGTVRRVITPPPSAEERERAAARQREQAVAATREANERRRESLLLQRYPDATAHQRAHEAALQQVQSTLEAAQAYAQALEHERERIDEELAFYRRDPARAPAALKQRLAQNAQQRLQQAQFIADLQRERRRIDERFEAERHTLERLWSAAATNAGNDTAQQRR
ncbi:DUF4124 domain-containing protein [Tepidimonas charontis]|uniref:DUF4124 domain-containing protein n=1 Tax=Tepidimonas charontis TaxID=2267262 RepID=UPI0013760439|nr:DUF4124 domain-containing protein [Tepidimonas charontis]